MHLSGGHQGHAFTPRLYGNVWQSQAITNVKSVLTNYRLEALTEERIEWFDEVGEGRARSDCGEIWFCPKCPSHPKPHNPNKIHVSRAFFTEKGFLRTV